PQLTWTARRTATGIVLDGEVPDSATREALRERASELFPGAQVEDRMRIVPGDGRRWRRVAETGLELLGNVRTGSARITGQDLVVQGEAPDEASAAAVRQRLRSALADGYRGVGRVTVLSDAMIWAAEEEKRRAREAQQRRADEARQASIEREREAERRAEAERVAAEAERRAAAAERERRAAEREAAEAKRRLEVEREAEAARLRAEAEARERAAAARARREAAARAAEAEAKRLADERARARQQAEDERRIRLALDQARCEASLEEVRSGSKIRFATGKANIARRSFGLLDRLAGALKSCNNVEIDIEGHTDSQGSDDTNLALSERRAEAVRTYLVRAGVDPDQLDAIGFGETRPAVPNTSRANMARNRRIEFVVRVDG
ncbi:MAG: OmpA family protein, partial [Pseudomonadota bacterium]